MNMHLFERRLPNSNLHDEIYFGVLMCYFMTVDFFPVLSKRGHFVSHLGIRNKKYLLL